MNRRGFLKGLLGLGAALAVPSIAIGKPEKRVLKATWTLESEQDLIVEHGLDAEQELADILAKEIREEIDKELIYKLKRSDERRVFHVDKDYKIDLTKKTGDIYYDTANDDVLVGYKGRTKYDSGMFYAPYIPVMKTKI